MRHSKGSSAFLAQTCFPHKPRNQRTLAWPGPFHGRHRLLCSFGDREQGKATLFRVGMKALSWALPVMLCVLGKVTQPLSASFSSSAKHHNHRRSGIQHVQILWNMAQHKTGSVDIGIMPPSFVLCPLLGPSWPRRASAAEVGVARASVANLAMWLIPAVPRRACIVSGAETHRCSGSDPG